MDSKSNIANELVSTFKNLPVATQSEVFVAITEIMASNNPELKETFADQLEDEQRGDYWDTLTEKQKQELIQALREADEGKAYSHEQVKQEAIERIKVGSNMHTITGRHSAETLGISKIDFMGNISCFCT